MLSIDEYARKHIDPAIDRLRESIKGQFCKTCRWCDVHVYVHKDNYEKLMDGSIQGRIRYICEDPSKKIYTRVGRKTFKKVKTGPDRWCENYQQDSDEKSPDIHIYSN